MPIRHSSAERSKRKTLIRSRECASLGRDNKGTSALMHGKGPSELRGSSIISGSTLHCASGVSQHQVLRVLVAESRGLLLRCNVQAGRRPPSRSARDVHKDDSSRGEAVPDLVASRVVLVCPGLRSAASSSSSSSNNTERIMSIIPYPTIPTYRIASPSEKYTCNIIITTR